MTPVADDFLVIVKTELDVCYNSCCYTRGTCTREQDEKEERLDYTSHSDFGLA